MSTTIEWIAIKFGNDIHVTHIMNSINVGGAPPATTRWSSFCKIQSVAQFFSVEVFFSYLLFLVGEKLPHFHSFWRCTRLVVLRCPCLN